VTGPAVPPPPKLPGWALLQQLAAGALEGVSNLPADFADLFDFAAPSNTGRPVEHGSTTRKWRERTRRLAELAADRPASTGQQVARGAGSLYGGIVGSLGLPAGMPSLRVKDVGPRVADAVLKHSGGATLNPKTLKPMKGSGYLVADPRFTQTFTPENQAEAVAQWAARPEVAERLKKPGAHIGTWRDPETGILEVNVSDAVEDLERARRLGIARNQKAAGHIKAGAYQGDINLPALRADAVPEVAQLFGDEFGGHIPTELPQLDEARSRAMAQAYERLPVFDEAARPAYDALNKKIAEQKAAAERAGFKFEYVDEDPYKSSAEMLKDVRENKRLKVLKTNASSQHPYMTPQQNDDFRAVHDLTHSAGGLPFGPRGEEATTRLHASTMDELAQRALLTETRGQNSWVNFGPNAHLPAAERPFAPQKAALWPEEFVPGEAPERITAASIRVGGREFDDLNHGFTYNAAREAGLDPDVLPFEDGFRTSRGRFVSREEAKDIAFGRPVGSSDAGDGLLSEEIFEKPPAPPAKALLQAQPKKLPRITALEAHQELIRGRKPLTLAKPGVKKSVAMQRGLAEVEEALKRPGNALDWYRDAVATMEENTKAIFPATEAPEKMGVFKAVLSIMSNGQKVDPNYKSAVQVYERYLKTGRLEMGEGVMRSPRWRTHAKQLQKLDAMIRERGEAGTVDHLLGETNVLKKGTRLEPTSVANFGPKIGRFFWNLNGKHGEVTVDLWATRTWRRWMGEIRTRTDKYDRVILDDAPDAQEKTLIRGVMTSMADRLKQKTGQELRPADVQALLWFFEQELHRSKGAKNVSRSFAEAARDFRAKYATGR
jgi:hypothetical protein